MLSNWTFGDSLGGGTPSCHMVFFFYQIEEIGNENFVLYLNEEEKT